METAGNLRNHLLDKVDGIGLVHHHFRTMFTAGMGFFTDAYDLFIIGVVIALLAPIWHLSTSEIAILGSSSLLAAAFGAYLFGRIADIFGRRAIYGIEVLILTIGAIGSAFSQDITQLIIWRIILGIGIGGDYPISAIIMSEYANRKDRGKLVSMVFSLQGLGLIAGPIAAILVLTVGIPHDVAWRILLGLGAIPAASVIYLRRKIKETPYYSINVRGDVNQTVAAINDIVGTKIKVDENKYGKENVAKLKTRWYDLFKYPNNLRLIGTAGSWFLMDWAFYGNSISWPLVMKSVMPNANLIHRLALSTIVFIVFAAPFYWIAAFAMDKLGRKFIQILGFFGMALAYLIISLTSFGGYVLVPAMFVLIFGMSYVFTEFGPNTTTFIYPSEVFPTPIRGLGDGISAGTGKIGAFIGTLLFPFLIVSIKLGGTFMILTIISFAGAILTIFALPETKGQSLRVVGEEEKYTEEGNSAARHNT
ncbi:MFS transporter [Candidatus Acidulodesulfobacterium sp. H_13]|uniref:MFS transporter n=1 Tax=Candidatus Acidulodesulfobacterium sp. H_13 TaxID=3395470 RepID=UPI003AF579BD